MRLCPIFELVVIAEIDFAQSVRLGWAFIVAGPAGERLLRRAAVAAAGIVNEGIARQCRRRCAELQRPDIDAPGSIFCASGACAEHGDRRQSNDCAHETFWNEEKGTPLASPLSDPPSVQRKYK